VLAPDTMVNGRYRIVELVGAGGIFVSHALEDNIWYRTFVEALRLRQTPTIQQKCV
jgi:hypothetical protein